MRTPLDALLTERALHFVTTRHNPDLVEAIIDHTEHSDLHQARIKNVCAKVSVNLSNSIDEVCALLGVQKRRFLEAAFMEAVERARVIMEAEGVDELLAEKSAKAGKVA